MLPRKVTWHGCWRRLPDSSLRNGPEAVLLAEQAESERSPSANHAIVLRILAAAYAETGRFADAKRDC